MLCHCNNKYTLVEVNVRFGNIRKVYYCEKGHRRDVVRDRGQIEIVDYINNSQVKKRIDINEDAYQTDRLSGRRFR